MKNSIIVLLIVIACGLSSCKSGNDSKKPTTQTYVVKTEPMHKTLFFTGTIQPLRESTLTSPLDAIVENMYYHYGQAVKKGEIVLTLNSNELQKQYHETLTDYLKAKDSFTIAQAKFRGTQELWDAGLLSKNNFLSEKSSVATARMSLIQATRKLTEMLEKIDDSSAKSISALNIADFDKVRQALMGNHNLIQLKAPADGVLLYPPKAADDGGGKLNVGSAVKAGQVLALVGDLTGISVEIDVPEIDIDKIQPGMIARVTGVALGKQVLKGELVAINAQASNSAGGNLPSFSALVEVKELDDIQRRWIKVGMSASIEIAIDNDDQLLIPIAAIKQERGKSMVRIQDKAGTIKSRQVTTGAALADKVVIASGLKSGDVVAYD